MLTLKKNHLRAALSHAAVKDIRFYLKGVCVDVASTGAGYLVGCDGDSMFVGRVGAVCEQNGPFQIVIPSDAVKLASKGKGEVVLKARDDGRYELGDVVFSPIDGRFPDWRRVCVPGAAGADYDAGLVSRSQDALREWIDLKKYNARMRSNIVTLEHCPNAFCVVMSLRLKDENFVDHFVAQR